MIAAFLAVVLAFHFFLLHFVNHADEVTFALSQAHMEQLTYFSLMILLPIIVTFYGANSAYNTPIDQGLFGVRRTAVKTALGLASVLLIVQGACTALKWAEGVLI